jgi:hypothetical protein
MILVRTNHPYLRVGCHTGVSHHHHGAMKKTVRTGEEGGRDLNIGGETSSQKVTGDTRIHPSLRSSRGRVGVGLTERRRMESMMR